MRNLPQDYTFNQQRGIRKMISALKKNMGLKKPQLFHSVDLVSATDTIPRKLSFFILEKILTSYGYYSQPDLVSRSIEAILCNRPFEFSNRQVHYKTGQPMGAYTSFPLLGLTQHLLCRMAHVIEGVKIRVSSYAVVGDDIVITNTRVSKRYIELLEECGIPMNTSKSVISHNSFEFCKKYIRNGEITNFPSWKAHYVSTHTRDPSNILLLLKQFMVKIPSYRNLVRSGLFRPRHIKTALALHRELEIPGMPKVVRVPEVIWKHAVKVSAVQRHLLMPKLSKLTTGDDRVIHRIDHARTISSVYRNKSKKIRP